MLGLTLTYVKVFDLGTISVPLLLVDFVAFVTLRQWVFLTDPFFDNVLRFL